jgi:oligosaccharide repeat unit polymerase
MIIQAGLIYIYIHKITIFKVFKFFSISLLVIILFGILGDLRSGIGSIEYVAGISDNYPSFLPSGFIWAYVYITSPLSNLNHNIDLYSDFNFEPSLAFINLLPSIIRSKLVPSPGGMDFSLVNDNLNVSTMYPQYLSAFGYYGTLFFCLLYGWIVFCIYVKFLTNGYAILLFITSVLSHYLMLSIFVDCNLKSVFVFQVLVHYYIGTNFSLKRRYEKC